MSAATCRQSINHKKWPAPKAQERASEDQRSILVDGDAPSLMAMVARPVLGPVWECAPSPVDPELDSTRTGIRWRSRVHRGSSRAGIGIDISSRRCKKRLIEYLSTPRRDTARLGSPPFPAHSPPKRKEGQWPLSLFHFCGASSTLAPPPFR